MSRFSALAVMIIPFLVIVSIQALGLRPSTAGYGALIAGVTSVIAGTCFIISLRPAELRRGFAARVALSAASLSCVAVAALRPQWGTVLGLIAAVLLAAVVIGYGLTWARVVGRQREGAR